MDGEKVYSATTQPYSFSIGIPSNLITQLQNSVSKAIVGVVSALTGFSLLLGGMLLQN
ncbi:MAG: hypothetical protein QW273_03295 [Candidatus Pacearchaeota archaeon]